MNVKIDILTIHTLYDISFFKVFTKYFSVLIVLFNLKKS